MRLALFALLLPAVSFAAPKISVLPFTGPKAAAARAQLVDPLCDAVDCVPQAKVTRKGKPDFAKAKKEKLTHFVTGKVKGKKLEVVVQTTAKKVKLKKSYALGKTGKLTDAALASALFDLESAIGAPKKKKEEEEAPKEEEAPPKKEETKVEEKKEEPPPEEKQEEVAEEKKEEVREEKREEEQQEEEPSTPRKKRGPLVAAQIGSDFGMRFFTYSDVQTANLRSYKAYFMFLPRVHFELYPLSRVVDGIPGGIGVELDYFFAVGLQSSPTGGPNYPTRLSRLDLAARLRMTPFEGGLVLNPFVGYRMQNFSTGAASDGTRLTGLADVGYSALRIGATLEQPLLDDQAVLFGEVAVLPVLGTGALKDYFPKSGGFGFELSVGGGYEIYRNLQLRAALGLTRYGLGFTVDPADTYRASGASDLYPSASVALRYTY